MLCYFFCYAKFCCGILCTDVRLCYVTSDCIISYKVSYVMLCDVTLCYCTLRYIILCYVLLCYVVRCHGMLRNVMPCYSVIVLGVSV